MIWDTPCVVNLAVSSLNGTTSRIVKKSSNFSRQKGESADRTSTNSEQPPHGRAQMGVSENSVPLHPMVNDHYPY